MGWTWTNRNPRTTTIREFFETEFNGPNTRVLDVAVVGFTEAYLAVEAPDGVHAVVCLVGHAPHDYYNFGYKPIDESMGPVESKCPRRILERLTPLELLHPDGCEWAAEWRERCWSRIDRRESVKVSRGDTVRFASPLRFRGGDTRSELVFEKGSTFRSPSGHSLYRVPGWRDMNVTVVPRREKAGIGA